MAGGTASGRLVVLDRSGRAGKAFSLGTGAATVGRAMSCDVRILLPAVAPHHATLLVHRNQVLIRNEGDGETLVNGGAVSVSALQHNDVITVGGRQLRWEYDDPTAHRPLAPQPALYKAGRSARGARRGGSGGERPSHRALLGLRNSTPGNAGGKQVAIVQPQRRDASEQIEVRSVPNSPRSQNRSRRIDSLDNPPRASFNKCPPDTTQATLWIESRKPTTSPKNSPRKTPKSTPQESRKTPNKKTVERKSSPRKNISANITLDSTSTSDVSDRRSSLRKPGFVTPSRVLASRALSAKKSTPLRMLVLRKARSAQKPKVTKIEAPLKVDHMKQAALLLMTGRTPRGLQARASKGQRPTSARKSSRGSGNYVSVVEIADSTGQNSTFAPSDSSLSEVTAIGSPLLPSPKKSALKDPKAKRSIRKTESIKFDLSNLESYSSQDEDDAMVTGRSFRESKSIRDSKSQNSRTRRSTNKSSDGMTSEDEITLHYSDTSDKSPSPSPSPRRSIHSRTSTILQLSGSPLKNLERKTITPPESPSARKSLRGSMLVQKALETTEYSRRSTRTLTDHSFDETAESAFQTRTLSPRSARTVESYSIVDLVSSRESNNDTAKSVYNSAGSTRTSSIVFGTPRTGGNRTRSTIDPSTLPSSTPYLRRGRPSRSQSASNITKSSPNKSSGSVASRRSKSLTTPENSEETQKHITLNSTRVSRASKSRSRLNDSDLQLITSNIGGGDDSPRTSRRNTTANLSHAINSLSPKKSSPSLLTRTSSPIISSPKRSRTISPRISNNIQASPTFTQTSSRSSSKGSTPIVSPKTATSNTSSPRISAGSKRNSRSNLTLDTTYVSSDNEGIVTPENETVPLEQGTPVLSIQLLLNSSRNSLSSQMSPKGKPSENLKRKTIRSIRSGKKSQRGSAKSKSFTASTRKSLRSLRLNSRESNELNESVLFNDEKNVTPKSGGFKLVQEAVKNKHSTAKKPQSKRSIIDNLNDSDIVKQLFNSPVKRKLSQSMTEFSRKKLFDDEEVRRPTRNTIAFARTPEQSLLENTVRFSPDQFVSPLSTPASSPNLSGIKRLYTRNTPRNDLRDVEGVQGLLRSPRTRKSIKNDLTNVSGVKKLLHGRKSVKNDLTNVSGVKSLFRAQKEKASPKNDLTDVRGVRRLLTRKSVVNDLTNVSGVKQTFAKSPKNDLRDVRGVKSIFRQSRRSRKDDSHDLSGVEELFNESNISSTYNRDSEALFDQLIGKPPIKAVYSKSFLTKRVQRGKKTRHAKSLHASVDLITNNVEQWLQQELDKHLHKNQSMSRAMQQLATDTVEGNAPILQSRGRNSTLNRSMLNVSDKKKSASEIYDAHTLPIKKRSLNKSGGKNKSGVNKSILPIKKRVVHSTPVKGRVNITMNASELGRVSPIAAMEKTVAQDDSANRSKLIKASLRGKKANVAFDLQLNVINEPRKSKVDKSPKAKPQSPKRGARNNLAQKATTSKDEEKNTAAKPSVKTGRKTTANNKELILETELPIAKRRRGLASTTALETPVNTGRRTRNNISKQANNESPKPKGKKGPKTVKTAVNKTVSKAPSPKKTRGGRSTNTTLNRKDTEVTNTKRRRNSLVITKKPPVMSPKVSKTTRSKAIGLEEEKDITAKQSPKKTRAKLVISKPSPKINPRSEATQTRRGRRQISKAKTPSPVKPQKTTKQNPKSSEKKPSPLKRSANKSQDAEPPAKRGRNAKNVTIKSPKTTRGKASQDAAAPAKSSRRRANTEPTENPRKRKSTEPPPVPAKVAKTTRGRKAVESLVVSVSPKGIRTVSPGKKNTKAKKPSPAASQKDESLPPPRSTRRGAANQTKNTPAKRKQSPVKATPVKKTTSKKASPKNVKTSAKKAKVSPAEKTKVSPAKKAKVSPANKAKVSPVKKRITANRKASPVKKVISSPAKKVKAAPAKTAKAAPKKVASPVKAKTPAKKKTAPTKKVKATPVKKASPSPKKGKSQAKTTKVSPVKQVKESPVKRTRGRKTAAQAASSAPKRKQVAAAPATAANTRSRRR